MYLPSIFTGLVSMDSFNHELTFPSIVCWIWEWETQGYGGLNVFIVLSILYQGLEHPQIVVYKGDSWNQFLEDTKERVYLFWLKAYKNSRVKSYGFIFFSNLFMITFISFRISTTSSLNVVFIFLYCSSFQTNLKMH